MADFPLQAGDAACETGFGNHTCTLRAAVQLANAQPGPDVINLQPGATYFLDRPGIDNSAQNGDLDLNGTVTINGHGSTIDGDGGVIQDGAFQVLSGTVQISNVIIQNGQSASGAGINISSGDLVLSHSTVTGNKATVGGGVYQSAGTVTLDHVVVISNVAQIASGGGIYVNGAMTLTGSTVAGNQASGSQYGYGGGIVTAGTLVVLDSTIDGNQARQAGGGIYAGAGNLTVVNSTIDNNSSGGIGAGIQVSGGVTSLSNVTIADNVAGVNSPGGGLRQSSGLVTLGNSLLSGNTHLTNISPFFVYDDCSGASLLSLDYNLIYVPTGCMFSGLTAHNVLNHDPLLGSLQHNGGPTRTAALGPGSLAIDGGNTGGCAGLLGALLTTDQRGYHRPANGICDIGAFEFGATAPPILFLPLVRR